MAIGMIVEFLKAEGKTPVDIERLNMWARGTEFEWAVALIKMDGILSGPGDVLRGREEMRAITVSSEQRRSSEQGEVEFSGGKKVCGVESLVKKFANVLFRRLHLS